MKSEGIAHYLEVKAMCPAHGRKNYNENQQNINIVYQGEQVEIRMLIAKIERAMGEHDLKHYESPNLKSTGQLISLRNKLREALQCLNAL